MLPGQRKGRLRVLGVRQIPRRETFLWNLEARGRRPPRRLGLAFGDLAPCPGPESHLGPASHTASGAFRRPAAASSGRTPNRATGRPRGGLVFWQFWQWVPGRACNRSWGGAQLRASGDVIEWICQYFHIGFAGCITAAAQRTKQFDRFRR